MDGVTDENGGIPFRTQSKVRHEYLCSALKPIFLMIKIFRFPGLFLMTAGIRKGGTGGGYPESPQWYGGRRGHMAAWNA